jgi:hypothetical protein
MAGAAALGLFRELRTQPVRHRPRTSRRGQVEHKPVATFLASARPPPPAHSPRATSCRNSRPPRRPAAQAASSFTPPLRRPGDRGLPPPFGQSAPRGARFSRIPSRLAHRARPIRQCRDDATLSRLLPPSPPTRGSGCLQLHPTATTAGRWTVFHLHSGKVSASWRTIRPVIHNPAPGRGAARWPWFPAAFRLPAFALRPSFPAWYSAPLTIGLPVPPGHWTMTGFPRSAHASDDRIGCPLYPGTSGAHPDRI